MTLLPGEIPRCLRARNIGCDKVNRWVRLHFSRVTDRTRPLWDVTLFEGLPGRSLLCFQQAPRFRRRLHFKTSPEDWEMPARDICGFIGSANPAQGSAPSGGRTQFPDIMDIPDCSCIFANGSIAENLPIRATFRIALRDQTAGCRNSSPAFACASI